MSLTDIEAPPLADVLSTLSVDPAQGLSAEEAASRLAQHGPNALPGKTVPFLTKLLGRFTGPIAYMIEAAALVSLLLGRWEDFIIIFGLLIFNAALELWQDRKANAALAALKEGLAPQARVLRDGSWTTREARELVPGDIVRIRLGDIVPADLRLTAGDFASIDQASLTGESLPVSKGLGDLAYSGSIVRQGEVEAVVIATGSDTFLGRAARLVAGAGAESHAQKAMFQIGNILIATATVLALAMVAVQVYRDIVVSSTWGLADALDILQFVLILLVASIPVAMPAVFSITLALGALALSKDKAIVSRLSSIDELAGVNILCSDKTGTLTKNQLTLDIPLPVQGTDPAETLLIAALASRPGSDAIDDAVLSASLVTEARATETRNRHRVVTFTPFDPVSKRAQAEVKDPEGRVFLATKGAPQAIVDLAQAGSEVAQAVNRHVAELGKKGYRALAVARSDDGGTAWRILGVLPLFDPPRDDSRRTIEAVRARGVSVKMITGDDTAIARETARQLGLGMNIATAAESFPRDMDPDNPPAAVIDLIERADGFARVFPEHKYAIVKALQKRGHVVAMTGDGVNDAPALKQADCGVAVSGATDAARGAAGVILTAPGLSVIAKAIEESRRIFMRITSYTIYRVALTMDIMALVVLSTIFLGFQPLTAVMIVVMSLLDDIPIMTIAYDRTSAGPEPTRWRMPHLMGVAGGLGLASLIQSFGLLLIGMEVLSDPTRHAAFGLTDAAHLQTVMFLQLVAGGHLLLLVARTKGWFLSPPHPAPTLLVAIGATQAVAVLMCGFGWVVPAIPWSLIGWVWLYMLVWLVILGGLRLGLEKALVGGLGSWRHYRDWLRTPLFPTRP
ncbi:MAG: plasma-membrane proton-efflux P-type ATPase [Rhodospirillum sp.]|nr:plasma-membrane proton-efflux P-type ATPase [Rhodospirillum sp.]MCF8492039.1 plasma-membrane proton-efflux P-type ATPase [Rhodospirillum sp.]